MERVTRIRVVIESHLSKALRHVACVAAFSKMPVVIVIVLMAGNACGIHRVTEGIVAVTVAAHQRRVFADQIERGIAGMVKRCVMPVSWLMAVAALLSAAPIVRIIVGMAAEACRGRVDKGVIGMAVKTARCCMAADQRETGLLVIKRHVFPTSRRMAIATTCANRFRVRAVRFVAGCAGRWRRPVLAVGFVAAGALQTIVFSLQGEIGVFVLKRGFVERDNVRVTPLMLGMAVRAVPALGVSVASVEALPGRDVISNILVAAGAQFGLFATLELDVARSAFLLDIGVPGNDLTGHDQRFQLGMCVLKYQHAEYQ